MSNQVNNLTINDFEAICRTCLSKGDLKPLYENCDEQTCLVEMLMTCTFVQFTKDDGLPVQICINCINDINQAFSFAKRCENADILLRKCIKQFKTKFKKEKITSESLNSHEAETIEVNPEIQLDDFKFLDQEISVEVPEMKEEIELPAKMEDEDEFDGGDDYDNDNDEDDTNDSDFKPFEDIEKPKQRKTRRRSSNSDRTKTDQYSDDQDDDDDDQNASVPPKKRNKLLKIRPKLPYYECKKCFEKFPDFASLKKHRLETKHPPNAYKPSPCSVCHKMIGYRLMNQHMRTHTGEKPYCCEICGASFSVGGNLSRHKRARHSAPEDRMYQCQTCEKSYKRLDLLKIHQRIHTGEKKPKPPNQILTRDFKCDQCDRAFTTKRLLRQHSVIHGEKTFLCSVCGRGFVSKVLLDSHSKVHTGLRPYACTVCGKAFSQLGSLKTHNLIHTGEKPNVCTVCNKAFTQPNHLKYHMRIHTGEKPYSCAVCGKSFSTNGTLTVHKRTHTGETPYICSVCGKGFYDSSSMKKHRRGHGENIIQNIPQDIQQNLQQNIPHEVEQQLTQNAPLNISQNITHNIQQNISQTIL